jgi:elongation factor Ts
LLNEKIAKIGENLVIRRFTRYAVGEGIEKKTENFAEEVAKQMNM